MVTANKGWEFTGWYVAGKNPQTIDKDVTSIDVMEYADFTNDEENGTLTIFATYEKEELPEVRTVNVAFNVNPEQGKFTDPAGAEVVTYNNIPETSEEQFNVPKVEANEGYKFTGWLVSGAGDEEDHWAATAETFKIADLVPHFPEGSNEGYVTVTAQFEEVEAPEERTVNVTFNVDPEQGRFTEPEGAEAVSYENIPESSEQQFAVPKVEANKGYKFTGWLVSGAEEGHWDATAETFGIAGLAHFPEGSNVGYVTITAQFEKVETPKPEERTVNVTFNVNPEEGKFTDPAGAEVVTYNNIPETSEEQFNVPKVEANEGYKFTGWLVSGAEEGHWDATAETFGIAGLAHFPEGSNVGYVTITAQFEKVETPRPEEKTVNVYFNVDHEKGYFTDPEGAEVVSYENLPENTTEQFLVPKVAAKEGYKFVGWKGQGADVI